MKVLLVLLLFSVFQMSSSNGLKAVGEVVALIVKSDWLKTLATSVNPAFGPVLGGVSLILRTFMESEAAIMEQSFEKIFNKLDDMDLKLDQIGNNLFRIENQINLLSVKISFDVRFSEYHSIHLSLKSDIDYFKNHILTFKGLDKKFQKKLNSFMTSYQRANYEYKLFQIVTVSHSIVHLSLMQTLINFLISEEDNNVNQMKTSPMQIVYEFYLSIIEDISEGDAMMNLCDTINREMFNDTSTYQRRSLLPDSFYKSFSQSLKLLESPKHRTVNRNFNEISEIKFSNVIMNIWINEVGLSGSRDSCSRTCSDYTYVPWNSNRCQGVVVNCVFKISVYLKLTLYHSKSSERLYDGYYYEKDGFFGKTSPLTSQMKSYNVFIYDCHVCRCVCDQSNRPTTVRSFSTARQEAPIGHVITAVRFREHRRVIFLQIQTAKLLPLSIVNRSTLAWQQLPDNDDSYFLYTLNYWKRLMLLSESNVGDGVLTGIQFHESGGKLAFRTYGREIKDFLAGTMGKEVSNEAKDSKTINNREFLMPGSSGTEFNVRKFETIRFGLSNERSDVSQNFVPYFDASEMTTESLTPLSGIGLLHFTGKKQYAGYIKPYLITMNYAAHIRSDNSQSKMRRQSTARKLN